MFNKIILPVALAFTLISALPATALAQSTNGTISGTVLDPSGALVPHAQVTIANSTGFSRTIKSGDAGTFQVAHLAPGSYSVSINALGFTSALEGGVEVSNNNVTRKNIKLGISVDQEIEVLASDAAPANSVVEPSSESFDGR